MPLSTPHEKWTITPSSSYGGSIGFFSGTVAYYDLVGDGNEKFVLTFRGLGAGLSPVPLGYNYSTSDMTSLTGPVTCPAHSRACDFAGRGVIADGSCAGLAIGPPGTSAQMLLFNASPVLVAGPLGTPLQIAQQFKRFATKKAPAGLARAIAFVGGLIKGKTAGMTWLVGRWSVHPV